MAKKATLFLRDFAIAAVTFLLVSAAVGRVLWWAGLSDRSLLDAKIAATAQQAPDVVFLGPSHIDTGLHSETFDAELAARGHVTRTSNMGIGGLSVVETPRVIERLLTLRPCCIKYLVLQPAYMLTNIGWEEITSRSIMFFDARNAVDFLRLTFAYTTLPAPGPRSPWTYARTIGLATAAHHGNIGLAAALLGWSKPMYDYSKVAFGGGHMHPEMAAEKVPNYLANVASVRIDRPKFLARHFAQPFVPEQIVNDEMLDHFIRTIRMIERQGVAVVAIQPPLVGNWPYAVAFVDGFRRRCNGQRLLDFSDPDEFAELYQTGANWHDGSHLSEAGAKAWSKMVAERFSQILVSDLAGGRASACP